MSVREGTEARGFFVAGGTLPLESGSYLERAADQNLLRSLTEGRFCYVLNSRQMGKSSLCVRTMARLAQQGVRCAFIDITKIGGRNVTPEQWYAGLAIEIGRTLDLRTQVLDYWKTEAHLGPMQRFFGALRDVVLATIPGHVVVFVDEIDSTRSLSFNTDEFFAGVRECFNRRVQDPEYNRLTFCFLGVAVPSDLIHDARTTPFNIGDRIYLKDFTYEELQPLAKQLGANGESVLQRVYYWTNGHPFLTQSVCRALSLQGHGIEVKDVDALIQRDLLEPKVRETNINLSDVGNRVLNGYADGDDVDQYRADILSAYDKALNGKTVLQDDESNRITAVLKLSGLMRSDGGTLKVRNRIYEKAFDRAWVRENMPGQELRRQRIAYYAGVARTTLVASAVIAIIGFLAFSNYRMARAAEATAREMSWRAYVADMNRLPILVEQNNVPQADRLLDAHRDDPWRGAEWDYWKGSLHTALWETTREYGKLRTTGGQSDLPEIVVSSQTGGLLFIDRATGKVARRLDVPWGPRYVLLSGGTRIVSVPSSGGGQILDANTGKVLKTIPSDVFLETYSAAYDSTGRYGVAERGTAQGIMDLETLKFVVVRPAIPVFFTSVTADGRFALRHGAVGERNVATRIDLATGKPTATFVLMGPTRTEVISSDNATLTVGYFDGMLRRFDFATGKLLWEFEMAKDAVINISLSADAQTIAAGTRRRRSYQVRVEDGRPRLVRSYLDAASAFVSADGKFVYTQYWTVRAYRADEGDPVKTTTMAGYGVFGFTHNPDRIIMAKGNEARSYPVVDGTLGKPTDYRYPAELEPWTFSRTQGMLMMAGKGGVHVFEMREGLRELLRVQGKPINDTAFQIGANRVLYSKDRLSYSIYEPSTGKASPEEIVFNDITHFHLSPQGDHLAARSESGVLTMFDPATLRRQWSIPTAHEQPILSVAFSRDGKWVASAAHDDSAAVWDARTGRLVSRFLGHAQSVTDVDFTPDGKRAITVSDDQTMRLWDVQTGAELTTLGNVGDFPVVCKITEDGKYVVTVANSGTIKIWPLYPPSSSPK